MDSMVADINGVEGILICSYIYIYIYIYGAHIYLYIYIFMYGAEGICGTEAGSCLRLIDSCITQLKAQGPSRTCNESKEEEEAWTVCSLS